jgi:RNA polymerase sigma-70 factor (ECF subfamily)
MRFTNHREDALDCAQETMIRIYRSLADYRFQASFSTWMYRVATNVCLDFLRRQKSKPKTSLDALVDSGYPMIDAKKTLEDVVYDQDRMAALREGITKLPPDMRVVLVLRDVQGLTYEEVASVLRINIGTVKSRINRARERLRVIVQRKLEQTHTQEQNPSQHVHVHERRKSHDL